MSVKRYRHDFDGSWEDENGHFVCWEDYARLKAEVERLKEKLSLTKLFPPIVESNAIPEGQAVLVNIYQHQQDAEEIKRLKSEVERLRKMLYDFVDAYEDGQLDALLFVIRQAPPGKPIAGSDGWFGVVPPPQEGEAQS